MDTFIRIKGSDIGLEADILIFSGETEEQMMQDLKRFIGPDTVVKDTR